MTRKNAQPQFGRPRFCTPAWAAAFRGSGSAWRLVMARMRPDSFHRLPRGRNAQGRTVAKAVAVAVASARERALDAEATSTGTAGRILRPSDSPAELVRRNVFRSDEITSLSLRRRQPAPD